MAERPHGYVPAISYDWLLPLYDPLLLSAAKGWKYRPATRDGQPVRFRKIIQVTLEGR